MRYPLAAAAVVKQREVTQPPVAACAYNNPRQNVKRGDMGHEARMIVDQALGASHVGRVRVLLAAHTGGWRESCNITRWADRVFVAAVVIVGGGNGGVGHPTKYLPYTHTYYIHTL